MTNNTPPPSKGTKPLEAGEKQDMQKVKEFPTTQGFKTVYFQHLTKKYVRLLTTKFLVSSF